MARSTIIRSNKRYSVRFPSENVELEGELCMPEDAIGVVVFAESCGERCQSIHDDVIINKLHESGLGTFQFPLLTESEQKLKEDAFDIPLLASRLTKAVCHLADHDYAPGLLYGFFGACNGGAAALVSAAQLPALIKAVVVRGGRPDLARGYLPSVKAPSLFLVGEYDKEIFQINRGAYKLLQGEKALVKVNGASHLFEEPGTIGIVADKAAHWFVAHLGKQASAAENIA